MDIENLAQKLEPLMAEQVQHWLRVRETAGSRFRALIDDEIVSAAYEVLGDFRRKLLLSLPPANKARGEIHLGTLLYEQRKWEVGLSRSELLQNLGIFGRSGSGKTNATFHILMQLMDKKIPFLFLDWKRTVRHLLPSVKGQVSVYTPGRSLSPFLFNPFIPPPGLEADVYVNHLVDVMADAYTLGDGSRSILQKAIRACYDLGNASPNTADVLREVEAIPGKGRVSGWKVSAVRALESLTLAKLSPKEQVSQEQLAEALLHGNTVIELDALSPSAKKFLIPILCLWIYYAKLASPAREQLSLVIFVEEAHHVLHGRGQRFRESLMEMLLRQCRELGIAMVVVDQHPHLISTAAVGNTYTSICLNQKDPRDINKAAGLSLVDDSEKRYFSMLPVGQAIVKLQGRWMRPFLIEIPLVEVAKGSVTDEVLSRYLRASRPDSGGKRSLRQEMTRLRRIRNQDIVLDEEALRFLHDVIHHQDDGVQARYKRLGMSMDKGNRLKEELVDSGMVDAADVRVGQSRKVVLRVAEKARKALGLDEVPAGNYGSLVHEYWKRHYARVFEESGWRVELEASRRSGKGRVDVLARRGAESVGIEVETGKSDVVWNVKQDLLAGLSRVIVVTTDQDALVKVERQLAKAGLIIPTRVEIVLRDALRNAA